MTLDGNGMAPGSLRGDDRSYAGYRGVGIRLSEPLDPLVPDAQQSAMFDRGLQQFDKAHLVMLAEQGIITREGAQACLGTLREMEADDLWRRPAPSCAAGSTAAKSTWSGASAWRSEA